MKTIEYLDACKEKLGDPDMSDYQLSKELAITRQALSKYRRDGATFNNSTARKVAAIVGIHHLRVIADAEQERAKSPEDRALWRELAGKLAAIAGAVGLAIAITHPAEVGAAVRSAVCVLCKIPRGRWLRRQFAIAAASLPSAAAPFCP